MTVAELIEALSEFPDYYHVGLSTMDYEGNVSEDYLESVSQGTGVVRLHDRMTTP